MREIKFRAWDSGRGIMVKDGDDMLNATQLKCNDDGVLILDSPILTFMQFTGLADKNGVEIYEGDIVSLNGSITGAEGLNPGFLFTEEDVAEIAWDNDIAAWSVAGKLDRKDRVEVTYRNHVVQLIQQGACEVIGNIHQNPELLATEATT